MVVILLGLMIGATLTMNHYSDEVLIPRFCQDPVATLNHLEQLLNDPQPAQQGPRRPYLIAAKLLYLLPQQSGEDQRDYLLRLRHELQQRCR